MGAVVVVVVRREGSRRLSEEETVDRDRSIADGTVKLLLFVAAAVAVAVVEALVSANSFSALRRYKGVCLFRSPATDMGLTTNSSSDGTPLVATAADEEEEVEACDSRRASATK